MLVVLLDTWLISYVLLLHKHWSLHKGDAFATSHQMDFLGKGKSILSCLQMEAYSAEINDRPCFLPGGKVNNVFLSMDTNLLWI
jgi:hypothetical protein